MDYLDPKKQFRHKIILMVGYVLVGIAIITGTMVLLYEAYGFGFNSNGAVIQNGLFFFSSQPSPADIYVNGKHESVRTNTRLSLPAGIYNVALKRAGYRDWQRTITLDGGSVEHFDYPLLVPDTLSPIKVSSYASAPGLVTQSPDRRWLLVERPASLTSFDLYDLKNMTKPPVRLTLPASLLTKSVASESLRLVDWADDSQHVLLEHVYGARTEFVVVDRNDPTKSVNLNKQLGINPAVLTLDNKKYDQYYVYSTAGLLLSKVALKDTTPQPYLNHVISYQSYGDNTMLYVTADGAPAGRVLVKLRSGDQTYAVRALPAGSKYLVDLTEYSGTMYVAVSASKEDKVYIYKDPVAQITSEPGRRPVPAQVLHLDNPDYLSFSDNAQFIVAEHGTEFGVYDIENQLAYHYVSPHALDKPQAHASWMDGDRLTYVSGGKLLIFDYDNSNQQSLVKTDARYLPAFTPDFKTVYGLAPGPALGHLDLDRTWLLTPRDR